MNKRRVLQSIGAIAVMLLLPACSGMDNIYHKEGDHFKNWRVKYSPHPFSPSVERDYNETCPPMLSDDTKPDLANCIPDNKLDGSVGYDMAKEPGYAGGMGGAVLNSAAMAFAGHQIGRGLGKSGSETSVNQQGGGAVSSSKSGANSNATNTNKQNIVDGPGHNVIIK
jgi:hypothetical protein